MIAKIFLSLILLIISLNAKSQISSSKHQVSDPWILSWLSFADIHKSPSASTTWQEVNFGYNFSDNFDIQLDWGYSGLVNPQSSSDAQIWDPEIIADWKFPLGDRSTLLASASMLIPAAPDSINNGLDYGLGGMIGLQWKYSVWTLEQTNKAYVFFYVNSPTFAPFAQMDSQGDAETQLPDGILNTTNSLVFYSTQQNLRLIRDFTHRWSGKIEAVLYMNFTSSFNPSQVLQLLSVGEFALTPQWHVLGGLSTSGEIDQAKGPAFFSAAGSALRLGFLAKW